MVVTPSVSTMVLIQAPPNNKSNFLGSVLGIWSSSQLATAVERGSRATAKSSKSTHQPALASDWSVAQPQDSHQRRTSSKFGAIHIGVDLQQGGGNIHATQQSCSPYPSTTIAHFCSFFKAFEVELASRGSDVGISPSLYFRHEGG